jgi:hypothetical protein
VVPVYMRTAGARTKTLPHKYVSLR